MINAKFKKVYELSNELQDKVLRQEYDRLSEFDKSIETFDEYINNEKKDYDEELSIEKRKQIEKSYINKETITKDDISFNLYLIHFNHTEPIKFDDNYKPMPLLSKEIFEYGIVLSTTDNDGYYSISGVLSGIEYNENDAIKKYEKLKDKIQKNSTDELLSEIENSIIQELKSM